MKKIISLLLALLMTFSLVTVAFATDAGDVTETPETSVGDSSETDEEDSLLGEYDWILDLPFGTVGPALKLAKIVLKLAKVYVKLAMIFGIIDEDEFYQQIGDFIGGLIGGETQPEDSVEPTDPVEPTEPVVA